MFEDILPKLWEVCTWKTALPGFGFDDSLKALWEAEHPTLGGANPKPPIWNICNRQIGSWNPQFLGENKTVELPPARTVVLITLQIFLSSHHTKPESITMTLNADTEQSFNFTILSSLPTPWTWCSTAEHATVVWKALIYNIFQCKRIINFKYLPKVLAWAVYSFSRYNQSQKTVGETCFTLVPWSLLILIPVAVAVACGTVLVGIHKFDRLM